jgi:hypothetical protein
MGKENQGDLFGRVTNSTPHYPDRPGWRDHDTSLASAVAIESVAATVRGEVVRLLKHRHSTVHEAAKELDRTVPTVQPRFSELVAQGVIIWTGERRVNQTSRHRAKVWKLVGDHGFEP